MADETLRGRFVWHELITPDAAGAHAFYTKTLGWKTQAWEQDPSYTMFVAPSGPLGGSVGRPSESARWLPYIGTEHIEGTVDQARSLGARVLTDVTGMANGGKYAVLEDPQGATFGVYLSPNEPQPEAQAKLGEYSWHELATDDYRAAFEFYSALFGWEETGQQDMGAPLGTYFMFGRGGNPMGGMFKRMPDMPASWLGYVRVKDVQQTIKKAKSGGATLLVGPMEVPGGDVIAQFNDPQGGTFAVHTFAADIKKTAPAASEAPAAEASQGEPESKEEQAVQAGAARRKASRKAASKSAAKKAASRPAKTAKKKAGKKAAKKKAGKQAAKKKAGKKAKATKKRRAAARGAKRQARKAARTSKAKRPAKKARGGAKKKAAKARKAK